MGRYEQRSVFSALQALHKALAVASSISPHFMIHLKNKLDQVESELVVVQMEKTSKVILNACNVTGLPGELIFDKTATAMMKNLVGLMEKPGFISLAHRVPSLRRAAQIGKVRVLSSHLIT